MLMQQYDSRVPSPLMDDRSRTLRRMVIDALDGGGRGHLGSSLSLIEILRVLYDDVLHYKADEPQWQQRDRFVLSKGHGCLALYAVLADKGFFPVDALRQFCRQGSFLGGHPERGKVPGVEASTGALGHGLSIAVGMALAARIKQQSHRLFVEMGDGEINEGSVWEAAMCAAKHALSNLSILVDYNKLQSYGPNSEVQPLEPLADKWRAFGFETIEIDGHDISALKKALQEPLATDKPSAIICHTVKGKGIPFAENQATWHHKSNMLPEDITEMYNALEAYDA
ncbi:MAG: transketolase [Spongiibacteraceae bacterium]|nr:transketolase [Spongiibacteraceae bacterium]